MTQSPGSVSVLRFFFLKHTAKLALLLILSLLVGGLEAVSVAVVYPLLQTAFEKTFIQNSFVLSLFTSIAGIIPVDDLFVAFCILFIILATLTFVIKILFIRFRLSFAGNLVESTQNEIYRKYLKADYQFFTEHKQGELVYNAISAPISLQLYLYSTTEVITQAIMSIMVFVLLVSLSWQGTIVVVVMGLLYYFFTRQLANRVAYEAAKRQATAMRNSTAILNETIDGIKQVKVFQTEKDWFQRFSETVSTYWYNLILQSTWQQSLQPALIVLLYVAIGFTALSIRYIAPNSFGDLIPVFGTFAFAVFRLVPIIGTMSNALMQIKTSLPNCETVFDILNKRFDKLAKGTRDLEVFSGSIDFNEVTFSYGKSKNPVLDGISVSIEHGKTTAIVGRSGSGKTTVINLILRLFEVTSGTLEIDGIDIKEITTSSWLEKIGYVSQDTFIFNDTIRNNITFGSDYSHEEVVQAAECAHAHMFISDLPEGYETIVGDRGIKLSGGQRQRIAIARAMARNPEILIFDEATNALDTLSEAAVQQAIDEIARYHTVIIIAHRLSTIVNADKIIVLGNGSVIEEGTHAELLSRRGTYYMMNEKQNT